jgi:hypothetical protein
MKNLILIVFIALGQTVLGQDIFIARNGEVSFFSETPLENISALNKNVTALLNIKTGDVAIKMQTAQFVFPNKLMEEHFNENYLETEKKGAKDANGAYTYPNRNAIFKGKINEKIDYGKDGENKVTVTGKLEIHGTARDVTIDGVLTKTGIELVLASKFKISVADYNIKVPSMYVKNIAEIVDVTINTTLEPYQKK